jgi:hypothetical protein
MVGENPEVHVEDRRIGLTESVIVPLIFLLGIYPNRSV